MDLFGKKKAADEKDKELILQTEVDYDAGLLRDTCAIEVLDYLCVQSERTPGSMAYSLSEPDSRGKRTVTGLQGVSNENCFGKYEWQSNMTQSQLENLRLIDGEVAKKITSLDRDTLEFTLGDLLPKDQIDAAMNRVEKLKVHIKKHMAAIDGGEPEEDHHHQGAGQGGKAGRSAESRFQVGGCHWKEVRGRHRQDEGRAEEAGPEGEVKGTCDSGKAGENLGRKDVMRLFRRKKFVYGALACSFLACLPWVPVLAAEPGWAKQEDGWYFYMEDGSPGRGWVESGGASYYLLEGGKMFAGGLTPDGYYVDNDGAWYRRKEAILGGEFTAPSRALLLTESWPGKEAFVSLKTTVSQGFSGNRTVKISDNAVEYVVGEALDKTQSKTSMDYNVVNRDNVDAILSGRTPTVVSPSQNSAQSAKKQKATVLLGLYREATQGRFRMDIHIPLDGDVTAKYQASSYDYGVFRAMAYQISSTPEILADSLYSAWEEDNRWGISRQKWVQVGDCLVLYTSGDGFGRFYITPAWRGN